MKHESYSQKVEKREGLSRKFKTALIPFLLKIEGWLDTPMIPMSNQQKAILKTPYMNLHHPAEP